MSLLKDFKIIQGDSSEATYLFTYEEIETFDSDWSCELVVRDKLGEGDILLRRPLPLCLNAVDEKGQPLLDNSHYVFSLVPSDTETLSPKIYSLTIEMKNTTIDFNREIVQCKMTTLKQGITT